MGHWIAVRLRKSVMLPVEERHAKLSRQMPFTLPMHAMWYIYDGLIPASSPHFKFLTTADLHIDVCPTSLKRGHQAPPKGPYKH